MTDVQRFFTATSTGQLAGAIAAVTVVSVTIRAISGIDHFSVPFATSLVLVYVTAGAAGTLLRVPASEFPEREFFSALLSWFIPFLNTCLLFVAVLGVTPLGGAIERKVASLRSPPQQSDKALADIKKLMVGKDTTWKVIANCDTSKSGELYSLGTGYCFRNFDKIPNKTPTDNNAAQFIQLQENDKAVFRDWW